MDLDQLLDRSHGNFVEWQRVCQRRSGGVVLDEGETCCWAGTTTFPVFANGAARTELATPPGDVIDRCVEFFATRDRRWSLFAFEPRDEDLAAAALERGFTRLTDAPQMVLEEPIAPAVASDGIELRRVTDTARMIDFARVNGEAFSVYGMPAEVTEATFTPPEPWLAADTIAFVAYIDGFAASAALTFASHGLGGVNNVATTEVARGRGLGMLTTRAVTNASFDELGCVAAALQASPMGEAIYRRMGYREIGRYRSYLAPAKPG